MSHLTKVAFGIFCLLVITLFPVSRAAAQHNDPPSKQFGVGIYASTFTLSGVEGTYAISPNIQVGTLLSFNVASGGGTGSFLLAPFFRYLFPSSISPFFEGGIAIQSGGGATASGLFLGGGIAYYLSHAIGVHAGVELLNLLFSPSGVSFGTSNLLIGADWFF
jgi:hypothetical protein